jgi:hypothetical protein
MTTNNIKNFCENLDKVDWEFVNSLYTAKEKFEWFFENFLKIFYQCCPKKRQKKILKISCGLVKNLKENETYLKH